MAAEEGTTGGGGDADGGGVAAAPDFWRDYWEPGVSGSRIVPRRLPLTAAAASGGAAAIASRVVRYGPAPQHFCELRLPTPASAGRLRRQHPSKQPAAGGGVPVAVFVHGGFWKSEW
jgi:hypothetical protein